MPLPARRGLFLDLDGTLAQSLDVLKTVYHTFLESQGRAGSAAEFARLNGPSLAEVVAALKRDHNLAGSQDELLARYRAMVGEAYAGVGPTAGALDVVAAAGAAGWKIAVVTSNTTAVATQWLRSVKLIDKITAVVTGEMVAHGKPAPDIYAKAVEICACVSAESYAVEDSPIGAASAVAAGLRTFALIRTEAAALDWPKAASPIDRLDRLIPVLQAQGR
jgi:beta-phosphoglucomutase-like phosphatase (HAD superfamily)